MTEVVTSEGSEACISAEGLSSLEAGLLMFRGRVLSGVAPEVLVGVLKVVCEESAMEGGRGWLKMLVLPMD